MVQIHLRLIIAAKKEAGAHRVLAKLQELIELKVLGFSPYQKGGFEINSTLEIPVLPWPETVVETLGLAQRFGYGWGISGDIDEVLEISCSRFKIQGLEYAGIYVENAPQEISD